MTDTTFMLELLRERPCTTTEILRESFNRRGCGLTVHSRAADLRRMGHTVRCERVGASRGRPVHIYSLIEQPVQLELAS
jgi:predicted transcriptional regulator